MELRQVRAFLAVAREGSITAAAKSIRMTQPALSRMIKALEEELGVGLLERGAHSVSLTPAGEVLAKDGEKLVRMTEQIGERVRSAGIGEVLRVAYAPSLAGDLMGVALERFSQLHPRVRVALFDCSTAEMKAGLREGRFDLVLTVPDPEGGAGIDWRPVMRRNWMVAMAAGHRLAGRKSIRPADLDGEKLLLYQREEYPDYWRLVTEFCRDVGINPKLAGEFDGFSTLATAVESGMGIALVAEGGRVGSLGPRLVVRPLESGPEPVCVAAGMRAGAETGLPCQVLVEEIRRAAAEGQ